MWNGMRISWIVEDINNEMLNENDLEEFINRYFTINMLLYYHFFTTIDFLRCWCGRIVRIKMAVYRFQVPGLHKFKAYFLLFLQGRWQKTLWIRGLTFVYRCLCPLKARICLNRSYHSWGNSCLSLERQLLSNNFLTWFVETLWTGRIPHFRARTAVLWSEILSCFVHFDV